MKSLVARRRAAAAATALAVALGSVSVAGVVGAGSATARTASTSVDTTYLQDTLGLPASTVVEPVTYDRFQWLLQQEGQFAFAVGSPSDTFKTQIQAIDTAAKAKNVSRVYWFDPNLSGYDTALRNLDIRNASGIASLGSASQTTYGDLWKHVLALYLGNGYTTTPTPQTPSGTKYVVTPDNAVVNDSADPLWDYRTTATVTPVSASANVFFSYDKLRVVSTTPDKIAKGIDLGATLTGEQTFAGQINSVIDAVGGANIDRIDQFKWWQAENNRRLSTPAEIYGSKVLEDSEAASWNVEQLTYQQLLHVLDDDNADKNFVILFGGTWCPNTRAVIKDVNKQAIANGVKVYNFDTVLDGGVLDTRTTSGNNPIQIRNNANNGSVANANPSFLYGDLLRKYLRNIVTQYDPNNAAGDRVLYYPGGDTTATADVVRKLQVPFLINYERGTGNNPSGTSIKRQWIQQNVDASTGLPKFREYMSQFHFTNPTKRLGLSYATFPEALALPADPFNAPVSALLTPTELALPASEDKETLIQDRRDAVAGAYESRAFGQEAVAKLKTFFGGLPGAVESNQIVTVPTVAYGTAPKVTVAVVNEFGRIPAGPAKLTVAGKQYTVNVAASKAVFTLPKLTPGSYAYTLTYAADGQILPFAKAGKVAVGKTKVTKTAGAVVKAPTTKKSGKYKVTVTTPAGLSKASGKVTVTLTKGKTKKKVTGTVKSGVVTVKVPKSKKGTWKVKISYAGNGHYVAAGATGKSVVVKK